MFFVLMTPFDDCKETNPRHFISMKTWILLYLSISFLQILKDILIRKINHWYNYGLITYRSRVRYKLGLLVLTETIHTIWMIYGNVIYFNPPEKKEVMLCY